METMQSQPMLLPIGKRWRERREKWVARGPLFDPTRYGVDVLSEREAKAFVIREHYSASFPAARISFGLHRMTPARLPALCGVIVISVPMQQNTIPRYAGLSPNEGAEIGRLVLHDDVAFNGESWFVSRALELLRREKPLIRSLVSYADPLERRVAGGGIAKRAHYGQVYQALSGIFAGRATPRSLLIAPNGSVVSGRAISKLRNGEVGHAYAERALLNAGAPDPAPGESPAAWIQRVAAAPGFCRVRHPGNFAYVFPLSADARRLAIQANPVQLPYPKAAFAAA